MPNYDGRYEVEAAYEVTISSRALPHSLTFDVEPDGDFSPGDPADSIYLIQNDGASTLLIPAVDDMFEQLWLAMGAGTSQPVFTLWKYDPEPSADKTFITTWVGGITYSAGLGLTAIAAHYEILTFRSANGGYCKIQLMEDGASTSQAKQPIPSTGVFNSIKNQILGAGGIVRARDNSRLIARLNLSSGYNEKTTRQRFRTY